MTEQLAAGASAPADPGPVTLPNPPSIAEALAQQPAVAPPGEHKPDAKPDAKPEGDKPEGDAKPEAEGDQPEGDEPKKKPGSQRYKQRLARIEGDFEALLRENEELRQRAAPRDNPQGKAGIDRAPTEADYPNDYVAYDRALLKWETRQAVREELTNADRQKLDAKRDGLRRDFEQERIEAYEEYADTVRERIPDFDKVVRAAKDVVVKPAVIEELLASDKSALLQYHLAQNPDKVRELNAMTPRELAKEIGRLEARVHLPSPKKATEAPKPLTQPTGGAAPTVDLRTASMDEYVRARKAGQKI